MDLDLEVDMQRHIHDSLITRSRRTTSPQPDHSAWPPSWDLIIHGRPPPSDPQPTHKLLHHVPVEPRRVVYRLQHGRRRASPDARSQSAPSIANLLTSSVLDLRRLTSCVTYFRYWPAGHAWCAACAPPSAILSINCHPLQVQARVLQAHTDNDMLGSCLYPLRCSTACCTRPRRSTQAARTRTRPNHNLQRHAATRFPRHRRPACD
jgi:hypothetical protein